MFIAGNMLQAIATILDTILWLYMWVIIIRALISWVNPDPWNPDCPVFRKNDGAGPVSNSASVGMRGMGFDFSPIIAILIIVFLQIAVVDP